MQPYAQRQGKCHPSLAQADPDKGSSWDPSPSRDRAEPLSPTPMSSLQSQGNGGSRLNAGDGYCPQEEGRGSVPIHGHHLPACQGAPQSWGSKGCNLFPALPSPPPAPKRQREPQPQANGASSDTPFSKLSQMEEEPAQARGPTSCPKPSPPISSRAQVMSSVARAGETLALGAAAPLLPRPTLQFLYEAPCRWDIP